MSTRKICFSIDEFYHIYNRGTDKRDIFMDQEDRDRFQKLLYVSNGTTSFTFRELPFGSAYMKFERGEPLVSIGAYCLMPNHFHLLVRERRERGITMFMNKLLTSYSSYFNKKYDRSGRLFEGIFKATHPERDEYLKYLFSYIHLNPVKLIEPNWKKVGIKNSKKTTQFLNKYKHSSYVDYAGQGRRESVILSTKDFPDYFSNIGDFNSFIHEWLLFGNKRHFT